MITRRSLADEIDLIDQSIADLNGSKKDCFDAYRAQLAEAGVAKENIKLEIDATKAAIKRRRAVLKDQDAVEEKDALVDEIFAEITTAARAPRTRVENIEELGAGHTTAKLVETVAKGVQTELGRAALIAAIDVMIEREEAETPITGEVHDDQPETDEPDSQTDAAGEFERDMAQSVPALLTDGNIVADGSSRSADSHSALSSSQASEQAGATPPPVAPATPSAMNAKTKGDVIRLLRKFCQHADDLEKCGGQGSKHCTTCERLKSEAEAAA